MSKCAITQLINIKEGLIEQVHDPNKGNPLVDILFGQGDGLCIYYRDNANSIEGKVDLEIMNNYNQVCPQLQFNGNNFTIQKLHTQVGVKVNE